MRIKCIQKVENLGFKLISAPVTFIFARLHLLLGFMHPVNSWRSKLPNQLWNLFICFPRPSSCRKFNPHFPHWTSSLRPILIEINCLPPQDDLWKQVHSSVVVFSSHTSEITSVIISWQVRSPQKTSLAPIIKPLLSLNTLSLSLVRPELQAPVLDLCTTVTNLACSEANHFKDHKHLRLLPSHIVDLLFISFILFQLSR